MLKKYEKYTKIKVFCLFGLTFCGFYSIMHPEHLTIKRSTSLAQPPNTEKQEGEGMKNLKWRIPLITLLIAVLIGTCSRLVYTEIKPTTEAPAPEAVCKISPMSVCKSPNDQSECDCIPTETPVHLGDLTFSSWGASRVHLSGTTVGVYFRKQENQALNLTAWFLTADGQFVVFPPASPYGFVDSKNAWLKIDLYKMPRNCDIFVDAEFKGEIRQFACRKRHLEFGPLVRTPKPILPDFPALVHKGGFAGQLDIAFLKRRGQQVKIKAWATDLNKDTASRAKDVQFENKQPDYWTRSTTCHALIEAEELPPHCLITVQLTVNGETRKFTAELKSLKFVDE